MLEELVAQPICLFIYTCIHVKEINMFNLEINMFNFKLTDFYILMNEGKSVKIPLKYLLRFIILDSCLLMMCKQQVL